MLIRRGELFCRHHVPSLVQWRTSRPSTKTLTSSRELLNGRAVTDIHNEPTNPRSIIQRRDESTRFMYTPGVEQEKVVVKHLGSAGLQGGVTAMKQFLKTTFLPAGYPESVGPGYLNFVKLQSLHHVASSVNGVLASTFLLYGVGLGENAAPVAGAVNWVLKDGLGQIGTLMFGKLIAHRFDLNAKTWYLSASLMLNIGVYLELSTFMAPHHFLILASLANGIKGLAWMAGGSTRSAFNVSFARSNNIADITAKATAQTITASLFGNLIGVYLCSQIGQSLQYAVVACAITSCVHLGTAYWCVRGIPLSTLNPSRLQLLTDKFLSSRQSDMHGLPSPTILALEDPAVHFPRFQRDHRFLPVVSVGVDILELCGGSSRKLDELLEIYKDLPYIASVDDMDGSIKLIFKEDATQEECLRGYLNACILRSQARLNVPRILTPGELLGAIDDSATRLDEYSAKLRSAGWQYKRLQIEINSNRAMW